MLKFFTNKNNENTVCVITIANKAFLLVFFALVGFSCARISAPSGGPKDEAPPVPLRSKPINYSTNFNDKKIIILFDEFISLKNVRQELLVSPPISKKPEVKQRGKSLIIKLKEKLKDSTTYNFNFYNSIVDLNEGNLLPNFQFEFSTGPNFDSIYLAGFVKEAFDYKTEASLYVMAYENFNDTLPRTTLPDYIAKTDENGKFFITNLKNKSYYLFALKDMNNNRLFDLPNESIAFSDSAFKPDFKEIVITDTLRIIDSLALLKKDTVYHDSIIERREMVSTLSNVNLFMFNEDYKKQYCKNYKRTEKEVITIVFNRDLTDSISIFPLNKDVEKENWYKQEIFERKDSIVLWLTDSAMYNNDSLFFQLNYTMKDSNNEDFIKSDTIIMAFEFKEIEENKESKEKNKFKLNFLNNQKEKSEEKDTLPPPSLLSFETNAKSPFECNKPIELISKFPIETVSKDLIKLYKIIDDTVLTQIKFEIKKAETELRKHYISFDKNPEENFQLTILSGCFTDIYENINDSVSYKFKVRELEYYSTISLSIKNVHEKSIVQLLNEKEELIEEHTIHSDTLLFYNYLHPQKYVFKLFYDSNNNDKWDTGNLKNLLQPEKVFYFPQEVETKSNWDMEYEWDLYPIAPSSNLGKEEESELQNNKPKE